MTSKVKDIVYNYVYLTPIEQVITQDPLFLRLHYIHQNSFTYLTYPSSHNTRFSHSLGVMHLAGEVFKSSLTKTPKGKLVHFLRGVRKPLEQSLEYYFPEKCGGDECDDLYSALSAEIAEMDGKADGRLYAATVPSSLRQTNPGRATLAVVLFQALRLAAMLHDVGHPPFSHIVEYALLDAWSSSSKLPWGCGPYPGHEPISRTLALAILRGDGFQQHYLAIRSPAFFRACAALALYLLNVDPVGEPWSARDRGHHLEGLKRTILSGDIDADRLDYVARDGASAGLVLGYDTERLLDAAFLHAYKGEPVGVAYFSGALPAIEKFFSSRFDLYNWLIYHHDASRRNLAIQRLLYLVLTQDPENEIKSGTAGLAEELARMACGGKEADYKNYARFLDSYLIDWLWRLDEILADGSVTTAPVYQPLKLYLDLILRRQNFKLKTIFKKPGDYAKFAQSVLNIDESQVCGTETRRLNSGLRQSFDAFRAAKGLSADDKEGLARLQFAQDIERAIQNQVAGGENSETIYVYYTGTFRAAPRPNSFYIWNSPDVRVEVGAISPMMRMLEDAWEDSPHLLVYASIPHDESAHDVNEALDRVRQEIILGMKEYLSTASTMFTRALQRPP